MKSTSINPDISGRMVSARLNPFRTEKILQVKYRLLDNMTWPESLGRLKDLSYRAAVTGPHGSGKTTLIEGLVEPLEGMGFSVRHLFLNADMKNSDSGIIDEKGLGPKDIVLLDGADLMPLKAWLRFKKRTEGAGGLVITSHAEGMLPTLIRCRTTPELLVDIVEQLLGAEDCISGEKLLQLYREHDGNLRDVLRALYDIWSGKSCGVLTEP